MIRKILVALFFTGVIVACSSSGGGDDDDMNGGGGVVDNFDRGAMLTDFADNIIIPALTDFSVRMSALKSAGETFTSQPTTITLEAFQTAWYNAYKTWQYVEMFNIGKAEELQYSFYMNVYPVNTTEVENNITSGTYDLDVVGSQDAVGFPALDYLLHGLGATNADVVAKYTTDVNAANYRAYVNDILTQMDNLTDQVLNDWNTSYRSTFISSDGNTATSSLNKLVNDFIFYYEKGLRANKVGIPAGVFSSNPLADRVEALYRGNVSKDLAQEALQAVEDFFNGKEYNSNATGESFKSYLAALQRTDISSSINAQINVAQNQLSGLMDNFSQQVMTDNTQMLMAYDELQKVVVLIKVDMLQAFNINVDFVDADGD